MDFEQVLKEVVWRLVTEGRISYRRIKLSALVSMTMVWKNSVVN